MIPAGIIERAARGEFVHWRGTEVPYKRDWSRERGMQAAFEAVPGLPELIAAAIEYESAERTWREAGSKFTRAQTNRAAVAEIRVQTAAKTFARANAEDAT